MARFTFVVSLFTTLCLLLASFCHAQTDPISEAGLKPFGSYHGGDIDVVNLMNGKLDLHATVVSYPQRGGKLKMGFTLRYDNPIPTLYQQCVQGQQCTLYILDYSQGVQIVPDFQMRFTGSVVNNKSVASLILADESTHELGTTSGTVSESLDGTGWRYDSAADLLTDRDGVRYTGAGSTGLISQEDPNGNWVTASSSGWTDSVGRVVPVLPGAQTSDYSGCTGTQQTNSAYNWVVPGPNSGTSTYKLCYALFSVAFTIPGTSQNYSGGGTWLQSLVLPNGQAWTFEYDSQGNLSSITLPTGGTISYTWAWGRMCGPGSYPYRYYRAVTSRTVNANDGTGNHTWNYSLTGAQIYPNNPPGLTATVTDPMGNDSVHTFGALAQCSFYEGSETDYQGSASGGNILQSKTTSYSASTDENAPSDGYTHANNVLPIEIDTYLYSSGGAYQKKIVKKAYDGGFTYVGAWGYGTASYGLVTSEQDYDYGNSSQPMRTANTQYLALTNSTYLGYNLLDLPSSVQILNGSGTQMAYTTYGYDTPNIGGGPNGVYRGNQTTVNRWLNTTGQYLTTTKGYNSTGTIASVTDPGNHTTLYTYDSTRTFVIQTNLPDTNSPNLAHHVTHAAYDTNTGLPVSHTDENGNVTSYTFDAMWRILTITYPTGGGTDTFAYDDTPPSLSVELQHSIDGSRSTNEFVIFDQLGREISRSKQNDETVPWDKTDTCYDLRGLKSFASYPYQSNSYNSAQVCSGLGDAYGYDGVKRPTSVTHADGTSLVTSYSGAATSVTDEGNGTTSTQKVSQVDGLGRLISVCEVTSTAMTVGLSPTPGSCGQTIAATGFLTSYTYDVLGNLLNVTQGGLTQRSFSYDSLSRLLTANNPESGQTTYNYDVEGNVLTRVRPAPNQTSSSVTVTTTYATDALHRTSGVTYSDGTTPSVSLQYDQASISGHNPTNPSGRLTYETVGNGSTAGTVFGYDAMGRVSNQWECTPQNCGSGSFALAYTYDYAGGLTSMNNGVGTTFTYNLNREQRPTAVTSNYIQNGNPATLLSAVHYDAFGSVLGDSLPNGVNETYAYVPRGWLQMIASGGSGMVIHPSTAGSGSVTVAGLEKSINHSATPGTGTVTVGGSEGVYYTDPCQPGTSCPIPHYDAGYVQITVNGFVAKATYGSPSDTAASIASSLNTTLNGSSSPVTSSLSGTKLTLTAKTTGSGTNYSLAATSVSNDPTHFTPPSFNGTPSGSTLTGGANASTTYDSGTIKITMSGTDVASVSYGSGSTSASIASSLASQLNGDLVAASASGAVISITAVNTGSASNYSVSLSVVSNDPSDFNPASFSLSSSTGSHLTGGADEQVTGAAYSLLMSYSGNGNVLAAQDSANGNWTYGYDPMNRLINSSCAGNATANCPDGTGTQGFNYVYDRFGNRWQQNLTTGTGPSPQYGFDGNNHITGAPQNCTSNNPWCYDAAGNLMNDSFHAYTYDAENRIVKVDNGSTATYTYDAAGQRVRKAGATTVDYLYDHDGRQIAEVATNGTWNRQEIYLGGRHYATYSGTTTYFHNADWLGTERVRTNMAGVVSETCQGLAFGDSLVCVGPEPTPMHFTGKHRDAETNLDDFPARYYSSTQGRWLSPDWDTKPVTVPYAILGNPQTLNLYSYVGGDPTNHADADGHMELCSTCGASADSSSEAANQGSGQPGDKAQNPFNPTVTYDKNLSAKDLAADQSKVGAAVGVINSNWSKLSDQEKATIGDIKSIDVSGSAQRSYVQESTGKLTLTQDYVSQSSKAWLASAIAHDGEHVALFNSGGIGASRGIPAELKAMQFQLQVGTKFGLSATETKYLQGLIQNPSQLQKYINTPP